MRIRTRLLMLVLATLLPACLAAVIGIVYVYQNSLESNWRGLRETSRALAMLVENEFDTNRRALQIMALAPAFQEQNIKLMSEYVHRLGREHPVHYMVLSPEGRIVASSNLKASSEAGPWGGGFRASPPRDNDADVSPLYWSPHLRTMAFSLRVPVRNDERLLFILQAEIPVSEIQRMVENQRLPQRWIGTVLDANTVIVARSRESERFVGSNVTGPIRKKLETEEEGRNLGRALSGEMVNAYFSRMPGSGWTFVVSVPQSEWREPAMHAALLTGLALMLILGLGVAAVALLSRQVVRPIEALRAAAVEMGAGGSPVVSRSNIAELDDVGNELVNASRAIRGAESRLQEKVTQAVAETERTQRALLQAQKLESLGRLTGGIAHDFNNVLQTLTSGLHVAMHSSQDQRVRNLLTSCDRAVQRAVELTRQLMAFGRVQDARLASINLHSHLQSMLPLLRGALPVHVELDVRLHEVWPVTIDPLQLELALLNLTINARDAMPNGGRLTLSVENEHLSAPPEGLPPGPYVRLELIDTGQGMSQEVASRALDPFFTTKEVGAGSGLGLPQAYGFSRQSGGTLLLYSVAGEGTCVTILLPRSGLTPAAVLPLAREAEAEPPAGIRLLFVEDDELVRNVVVHALSVQGFAVTVATNADEALALLRSERFDLVFSDIVMPGSMNGIALAETVRREWPDTHMMLATGYSHDRSSVPGVRVLGKPYVVSQLVSALRTEMESRAL